jgi:hypothetical protein
VAKLLGTLPSTIAEEIMIQFSIKIERDFGRNDDTNPRVDGRVKFLLATQCNQKTLTHRDEDIRRRDGSGRAPNGGYRETPMEPTKLEVRAGAIPPDQQKQLDQKDLEKILRAVSNLIETNYGQDHDVFKLLQLVREKDLITENG